jgi:hypothetical protein
MALKTAGSSRSSASTERTSLARSRVLIFDQQGSIGEKSGE